MPISAAARKEAALLLASIPGIEANPTFLVENIGSIAQTWPNQKDFVSAINSTKQAVELLLSSSVDTASLTYELDGWQAFHYQHKRGQGMPANMRIIFRQDGPMLKVLAFGHRALPHSVYYAAKNRLQN